MEHIAQFPAFGMQCIAQFSIADDAQRTITIHAISAVGRYVHDITSIINDDPVIERDIKKHIAEHFFF